nr:ribonuclease H-like domain-containing protein [Tanacetum cinerariifolium]
MNDLFSSSLMSRIMKSTGIVDCHVVFIVFFLFFSDERDGIYVFDDGRFGLFPDQYFFEGLGGSFIVIKGEILNNFPRFVDILIAEFYAGSTVNFALNMKGDMIIKFSDLKPTIDAIMRDFLEELNVIPIALVARIGVFSKKFVRLEEEKALRHGQDFNWETTTYGKVSYFDDVNYFKAFEAEFPTIVFNDTLMSAMKVPSEPTLVMLIYQVSAVFNKVNAAKSRVTTAVKVSTTGWIKWLKDQDMHVNEEVIKNGNKVLMKTVGTVEQPYEPTSVEEKLDRKNEMKARETLLIALLNKDQLKFHSYQDAKFLMEAIEKRLQKLISQLEIQGEVIKQEDVNLKLLRSLPSEWKTHALIWRNKAEMETISLDDLALKNQENRGREYGRKTVPVENPTENALISHDGIGGYDWSYQDEEEHPTNFVLMALTSSGSSSNLDSEVDSCSKTCLKAYATLKEQYDSLSSASPVEESFVKSSKMIENQENVRSRLDKGYHAVPPPYRGNYIPLKPDLMYIDEQVKSEYVDVVSTVSSSVVKTVESKVEAVVVKKSEVEFEPKLEDKNVRPSFEKIKKFKTARETEEKVETPKQHNLMSQRLGSNFKMINKACYVCGSFEHLYYVCDQRVVKLAWNNTKRVNHKNFANKMTHPYPKRRFVPQAILTKLGKLKNAGASVNTVRPVNTADLKPIMNYSIPISNAFKIGYSQDIRPFNKYLAYKKTIFNKEVNVVKASACWV